MRRRDFIKGIAGTATAWPLGARAQKAAGKIQRIGIIDDSPSWDPFRQQLRELNYVEGQNLTYVVSAHRWQSRPIGCCCHGACAASGERNRGIRHTACQICTARYEDNTYRRD